MVDIGDGVMVPAVTDAEYLDPDGFRVKLTAVYDSATGRYRTSQVVVEATEPGVEITGETLRGIRLSQILAIAATAAYPDDLPSPVHDKGWRELLASGPTTEVLRMVARIYRAAVLVGDAPTQAVAERLGVPRSTAGRWVTRARDRGLLTVVDKRAAGRVVED